MTKSIRLDLTPIIVGSLVLVAGGFLEDPIFSWVSALIAGIVVGISSDTNKRYLMSLFILAFWLFVSGYTPLLEYTFALPPQLEPVLKVVYQLNETIGFEAFVWTLILLINWLGVFVGLKVQQKLTNKPSGSQEP